MPFTLAHPVVLIPLQKFFKDKLSLTGLIIGSVIPDFEYLVNIVERSVISHTLEGIIYFDIPAALIITFCWHGFVKQVLTGQLPSVIQKILLPYRDVNWFVYLKLNWHIYLISLLAGIFLHLFWDSFSHANGYFVVNYKFLHQTVFFESLTLYRCSWWISSVGGIYFMWKYVLNFPSPLPYQLSTLKNFWPLVYLISCAVLVWEWRPFVLPLNVRYLLVAFTGAVLFSIIIVSFILRLEREFKND